MYLILINDFITFSKKFLKNIEKIKKRIDKSKTDVDVLEQKIEEKFYAFKNAMLDDWVDFLIGDEENEKSAEEMKKIDEAIKDATKVFEKIKKEISFIRRII